MAKQIKQLLEDWDFALDSKQHAPIKSREVREVTARVLENTNNKAAGQEQIVVENTTGNIAGYDPVLISMVRRSMPSLIAYDIAGVQPMTGPTGKVFALKAFYGTDVTDPTQEAFTGTAPRVNHTGTMNTSTAETLGTEQNANGTGAVVAPTNAWAQMSVGIEGVTVEAKSRKVRATYTDELYQDMKALHGLDADAEISKILTGEIVAEQNRELVDLVNTSAVVGAQNTATAGTFDMDADTSGRWSVEKYKELMTYLYREATVVARDTRRGQANFIITSADIAAALCEASKLDTTFATQGLSFDGVGITFAGMLAGRFKLYVDAYAPSNYITLGYRGTEKYDAGIFWCPYVGLERRSTRKDADFQPQIGYQTRYGIAHNPLTDGGAQSNVYFRRFDLVNL